MLTSETHRFEDRSDGPHVYEVRSYLYGNDGGLPSLAESCYAGNADVNGPQIVVISPPASLKAGQPLWVKARLLDNRSAESLSAMLYYRNAGEKEWKEISDDEEGEDDFYCDC